LKGDDQTPEMAALAGIDSEQVRDKYPSLRFSEAVLTMISILNQRLRNLQHNGAKDDIVSSQILGLVLKKPMEKVWKDYEQHLYPYLSKTKLVTLIDESMKQIHNTNISNAIHAFNAFVSG
jgi:hypothetical protein